MAGQRLQALKCSWIFQIDREYDRHKGKMYREKTRSPAREQHDEKVEDRV
jgi:hypothetical protein